MEKTYSVLFTHQHRLICILSKIFNKKFKRFKNGCILKLVIHRETHNKIKTNERSAY